jgi:hypothetical protein
MKPADRRFLTESEGVLVSLDDLNFRIFIAGHWIDGVFKRPLDMSQDTVPVHYRQSKIFAFFRKQLGIISLDLDVREKIRLKLKEQDAAALRLLGYDIASVNIVAWWQLEQQPTLLFGGLRPDPAV